MSTPITAIREGTRFTQATAAVVITTFLSLILLPSAAAAKDALQNVPSPRAAAAVPAPPPDTLNDALRQAKAALPADASNAHNANIEALRQALLDMSTRLKEHRDLVIKRNGKDGTLHITIIGNSADVDLTEPRKRIGQLKEQFQQQDQEAEADFQRDLEHILTHHLPDTIRQRHAQALAEYRRERDAFNQALDALEKEKNLVKLIQHTEELLARTQRYLPQHAKFDPKNFPFRAADPKVRVPKTDAKELKDLFNPNIKKAEAEKLTAADRVEALNPLRLADLGKETTLKEYWALSKADERIEAAYAGTLKGILAVAALAPPGPEYLAPTEDVQITAAIRELAAQLHHHPVEIYNWVRNNIEFVPTYGSIQGSDMTLQTKRGNAFDTASLLIALLRAANIPARYVYGTVEISADQVMNWVGGVKVPEAALNLMGQGGIPSMGLVSGGKVAAMRIEHVWVEAFVDFYPSRGAKNIKPDTWMPLDASFKQFDYSAGLNLQQSMPFDYNGLLQDAQSDATVDDMQGWVQHLNDAVVLSRLGNYQQQLQTYIAQHYPDATVEDVVGAKVIQLRTAGTLPASLPYRLLATGARFSSLPARLRWNLTLNLYASAADIANQAPVLTAPLNVTSLGTKRLAVAYAPATEEDAQTIRSYEGQTKLPVYLINQTLKLHLDDQVLAEFGSQRMGNDQYWTYTLVKAGGEAIEEDFKLTSTVGDQVVFGIDGAGISEKLVASRYSAIDPNSPLENLQQLSLGYWARADVSDRMLAPLKGAVSYRLPSVGMFTQPLSVIYSWGVPKWGSYKSYAVDIRRLAVAASDRNGGSAADFVFQSGLYSSYLEGRIFEEVFDYAPGNGFSAVTIITQAISDGVPIWRVGANNLDLYLAASIITEDVKASIANAVNSGAVVLAPEAGVDVGFWQGSGYIAVDPETGAGAYILKGANGGEFEACEEKPQPLTQSITAQVLTFIALAAAAALIAGAIGGSGGLAAPPIALAMRAVGITMLTFSATSYAAGECKVTEKCHRGSIQAQGADIKGPGQGNSRTKSSPWAQPTPLTLQEGLGHLEALKAKLTAAEYEARITYFEWAEAFMRNAALSPSAICAPFQRPFGPNPNIKEHVKKGIRVDINVNAGQAFVP